jgi:hypothetical protein
MTDEISCSGWTVSGFADGSCGKCAETDDNVSLGGEGVEGSTFFGGDGRFTCCTGGDFRLLCCGCCCCGCGF